MRNRYIRILDKARDPRARSARGRALYVVYVPIAHGLRNLCHQKNAIMSAK